MTKIKFVALVMVVFIMSVFLLGFGFATEEFIPRQLNVSTPPYPGPEWTPKAQDSRTYLDLVYYGLSPFSTFSYYLTTTENLDELGCELGKQVWIESGAQNSFVFLDFGQPMDYGLGLYGTQLFDGSLITTSDIGEASFSFAEGYYNCLGSDHDSYLRLGIGTSNDGDDVSRSHGEKWAILVESINDRLLNQGYRGQVTAVGASNIEPDYSSVAVSTDWVDGFFSVYGFNEFYNIGAASGCSTDLPPTEPESGSYTPVLCNNGWTQESIYEVSWLNVGSRPIPLVYDRNRNMAQQWYRLALYSYLTHGGIIAHYGTLTQYSSCNQHQELCDDFGGIWCVHADECFVDGLDNEPIEGFEQLRKWVSSDPYNRVTDNMRWATDIEWYPSPLVYIMEE